MKIPLSFGGLLQSNHQHDYQIGVPLPDPPSGKKWLPYAATFAGPIVNGTIAGAYSVRVVVNQLDDEYTQVADYQWDFDNGTAPGGLQYPPVEGTELQDPVAVGAPLSARVGVNLNDATVHDQAEGIAVVLEFALVDA